MNPANSFCAPMFQVPNLTESIGQLCSACPDLSEQPLETHIQVVRTGSKDSPIRRKDSTIQGTPPRPSPPMPLPADIINVKDPFSSSQPLQHLGEKLQERMPSKRPRLNTDWGKREMTFVSLAESSVTDDGESLPRAGQTNNDPTTEDSRDTPNKDSSAVTSAYSTEFLGVMVRPL